MALTDPELPEGWAYVVSGPDKAKHVVKFTAPDKADVEVFKLTKDAYHGKSIDLSYTVIILISIHSGLALCHDRADVSKGQRPLRRNHSKCQSSELERKGFAGLG